MLVQSSRLSMSPRPGSKEVEELAPLPHGSLGLAWISAVALSVYVSAPLLCLA